MLPLQHQFTDSNRVAVLQNENHAILQNNFCPFDFTHSSSYDANLLRSDILLSNPRPLHASTADEMLDRSVSSLVSSDRGVEVLGSPFDTGSSNVDYLNSPLSETGASRVDQSISAVNPFDKEALNSLSKARCPLVKVESFEDFTLPRIGYPLQNSQGEQVNISKDVESQEPTECGVLIKRKKYCSNAALQSEGTTAIKARARKVLSGRIYRAKVAEAIKTLKSALPHSEKGNQASILDNVIDYIKFLKLQLNVLSQSRLNGEASAHSFVHIEGSGHFLLHPQTYHQPLEETVGRLLRADQQAADQLLEYKGLAILPMDSAYALLQNTPNPSPNSCHR